MTDTKPGISRDREIELDREIPVDRERTLNMVRSDYEFPWKGVLRESIQNAADAWGRNISDGVLDQGSPLNVSIELDTEDRTFRYQDNAGGMPRDVLENNLVGIDTPDDQKEKGRSAGAYGRGFHVVSMVGSGLTYVETKYETGHYCVNLNKQGKFSDPQEPETPKLSGYGTYIHVSDVLQQDINGRLADWSEVEQVLLENFNFLFLHPRVDVSYSIDGEEYTPQAVDLHEYKNKGEILVRDELEPFTFRDDEFHLQDFVMVDAEAVNQEPPWEGVALLKGNQYLEQPFMTVQVYKPRNISSLNKPARMFGWCNADDLCPELEDNAHTSFNSQALTNSGLKGIIRDIHNEHFRKEHRTQERQELRGDIKSNINELLTSFDDFTDYQVFSEGVEIDAEVGSGEGDYDRGESSGTAIICSAGRRVFDVGQNIPLEIALENPDDADLKKYEIFDIEVTSDVLDEDITFEDATVTVDSDETKIHNLTGFVPEKDGVYIFRAKSRPLDGEGEIKQSNVYVRVGDAEPQTTSQKETSSDSEGDGQQQVAIVESVQFSPDSDDPYKAALEPGDHGGFNILINTARPEWEAAEELEEDERRKVLQERLGTQWGAEQIVFNRQIDDLAEVAEKHGLGDAAEEELRDNLIDRDDMKAEIEFLISSEYGVGYE